MTPIKLKSSVCLSPGQCYNLETELPLWLVVLLAGSTIFLIKEIYYSIK